MDHCPRPRPSVQHAAPVPEGRSADALRRDLVRLPLLQHLPPVCAGAQLRGRAETGCLPEAALLAPQTGPGLHSEVEGQYLKPRFNNLACTHTYVFSLRIKTHAE